MGNGSGTEGRTQPDANVEEMAEGLDLRRWRKEYNLGHIHYTNQ